ncbi:MAG: KH domain-containing protein [Clostridiales bacterium]|nr:KH domain-containing protein [Clostridiales bacterium]
MSRYSDLVAFVARSIVTRPDEVSVAESHEGEEILVNLRVHPEDVGRVIGRQGRTIQAIRQLVRASASQDGKKVRVDIPDEK